MTYKPVVKALVPLVGKLVGKAGPKRLVLISALSALIATAYPVLAAVQDPEIEQLNQLVAANRYEDAYTLSKQLMKEHEGEPEFDFLFGLAALESGRANEAVFALERITYTYPDQLRVKLELARAFYEINNYQASRELFNEVLATNPTDNVKTNINVFLKLITEKENNIDGSFNFYLSSDFGSDSNINSATKLGVIPTPIGDVLLSANGKSISDNFNDLGAGVVYNKPFSKTSGLTLTGNLTHHNNFASNDFDLNIYAVDATYTDITGDTRMSYGVRDQRVDLNSEHFQDSTGLTVGMQHTGAEGWSQGLTGAYSQVRYDDSLNKNASLRDVNQMLVSGVLGKSIGKFSHTVSIYYGDEHAVNAIGSNNAQQFYGVAFSEQYQLNSTNAPYFRVTLHHSDNKDKDPIFNVERADKTYSTSLGWMWLMNREINVTTDLTYTNNSSNITLYEYDRVKFQTGIRYQF